MIRPLLLNKGDIAAVLAYAEAHRISYDAMLRHVAADAIGQPTPIGDNPHHKCLLFDGYQCVFSIEEHSPGKWFRHLSVSVANPGALPHPQAVDAIMDEFLFTDKNSTKGANILVWLEDIGRNHKAVNVVEPL